MKSSIISIGICLLFVLTVVNPMTLGYDVKIDIVSDSPPMDSPWPMQCYNTHHTSRSPYNTAHIDGLEKWRFKCGNVDGSPIIDENEIIYFGDEKEYIYALYPNGTLKWTYKTNMWITSAPALTKDRTLYVGSWDHYLYALNSSSGELNWRFDAKGIIASSPAIGDDGTIYFGTMWDSTTGNRIYAVNPDGSEKWQYKTGDSIISDPAIGDDGTIYIGSYDNYLYAMNPNGSLKWKFKTGDIVKGPPSIADDGTIYIGSFDDYLYALYPNGTIKWKCKFDYGTGTNPSIASDNTIYFGSYKKLYAVYPNGTIRWFFNIGAYTNIAQSSSAISADGTIYVGTNIGETDGGELIAINPDGTLKWKKFISNLWVDSSPCIAKDGTIYIGSNCRIGGYLHAFGPVDSNVPPEAPTIDGPINGADGDELEYMLKVVDPDNNPISFYIDWGDGTEGWQFERASSEECWYGHTWNRKGNYTIKVKARDTLGEESDWAYLEVNIPRTRTSSYHWLFERFPLLERLLSLLL